MRSTLFSRVPRIINRILCFLCSEMNIVDIKEMIFYYKTSNEITCKVKSFRLEKESESERERERKRERRLY